ncbi:hypothetical protein AX15_001871 [Amanita polypyramis BW_CC]|nr:hypothetical protein AX15_001871 [Amanita polypyramis BW_CC]
MPATSFTTDSSSSASTTPVILTPDSTGSLISGVPASPGFGVAAAGSPVTPIRRPTAVYSSTKSSAKTLKPFSRSAAKRESVLALGSIEHLQHYFTKTGLVANRDPLDKPHYGLVPAIGGAAYLPSLVMSSPSASTSTISIPTSPSTTNTYDPVTVTLPPSPQPRKPSFLPNLPKTYETDPESLLPGVVDDLNAVARAWNLDNDTDNVFSSQTPSREPIVMITPDTRTNQAFSQSGVDILELLKTTTRAIRSTRNYLVSLPDESVLSPIHTRAHFRPSVLGAGPPIEPRSKHAHDHRAHEASSSKSAMTKNPSGRTTERQEKHSTKRGSEDPSALVRKSALDVLAALREVEERYRLPLSDEAYDAQSDSGGGGGGHSHGPTVRATSPDLVSDHELDARHHDHDGDLSITYSLVQIQVGDRLEEVPVWEDEESDSDPEEEREKRELWDERLVLGSGWLYRQDVKMEEMQRERVVVGEYLDMADRVIFGGGLDGGDGEDPAVRKERGWEREKRKMIRSRSKGRRVSAGDGEGRSLATVVERSREQNRRVSASVVELLNGIRLTEEPEEMDLRGTSNIPEGMANVEEGDDEECVDEEDLPGWAKKGVFIGDDLGRAHALLSAFLPFHLLPALGPASPKSEFLNSLSSGQLLCVAYNMCVRKSKRPWGYVSKDSIHDIIALEKAQAEADAETEGRKKGWTFRRTDNLRLWIGALKLRYLLPIQTPNQPLNQSSLSSLQLIGQLQAGTSTPTQIRTPGSSPIKTRFGSTTEPVIEFDARLVARRDEGWEYMLEKVLVRWVWKATEEKRSFR